MERLPPLPLFPRSAAAGVQPLGHTARRGYPGAALVSSPPAVHAAVCVPELRRRGCLIRGSLVACLRADRRAAVENEILMIYNIYAREDRQ
jgi:hypothetical protein